MDSEALMELQRRKIGGVPTFFIDEEVVVGLDKNKILELVQH